MEQRRLGSKQKLDLPGSPLDPDNPPTAPFERKDSGCDKDCNICFPQHFPAQCSVSQEDAQETTNMLASAIKDDYDHLRCILETDANDLVNRWNKMSRNKREALLQENGDLFTEQPALVHLTNTNTKMGEDSVLRRMARQMAIPGFSPDKIEFLGRYRWQQMVPVILELSKTMFLDTWFLPYLDIESLSTSPLSFLSLLNSRTQYPPHQWTLFDKMHTVAAEYSHIMPGQYNPKCISFHPSDYGCLRDWDQALMHQQSILGYNQGMLVLTAQGRMMRFLRRVVDALLCEIQHRRRPGEVAVHGELDAINHRSVRVQEKWFQLVENGFSTFGTHPAVSWSSYTNQHLIAPPHADPVVLHNKIRAVYQDAFDNLWALQTDPGTVQLAVKELCSCLYFHYLDKAKEWDRIVDEVMLVPTRREMVWRQTLMESDRVMIARDSLKKEDTKENRLRFDLSLMVLWDCCSEQLTLAIQDLQYSLPYQPAFEKNYEWTRGSDGKRKAPRLHAKDWLIEDPLFWSLDCFCNDRYREFNCDPVVYLQVFDNKLRNASEKERRRLSPAFLTLVGDLAAIDEIRTAIQCTRGVNRNAIRDFAMDPRLKAENKERFELAETCIKMRNDVWNVSDLCNAAAPALKELCTRHPWPKGRTTTDTAQHAADARDVLAQIWEKMRRVFKRAIVKNGLGGPRMKQYLDKWSLDLSQDYQNLKQTEQSQIKAALQAQLEAKTRLKAASSALSLRPRSMATFEPPAPLNLRKTVLQDMSTNSPKIKTHGQSFVRESSPVPADSATSASAEVEIEIERIKVKPASLPLLHQMYPSEGLFSESNATETTLTGLRSWKWQHFVDVMLDTGFKVSQGSGSAVSFEHPSGKGRIVFHQPHPQPTIDPVMLRFMGRRMNRWFGWQRETFVEKE